MTLLFNLLGLTLIGLIIWWFWFSKAKAVRSEAQKTLIIEVKDGGYTPARIEVNSAQPIRLAFMRKDPSSCAEYLLFDTLGIHEQLPLNQVKEFDLGKLKPGNYPFSCQMHMYVGELIVK